MAIKSHCAAILTLGVHARNRDRLASRIHVVGKERGYCNQRRHRTRGLDGVVFNKLQLAGHEWIEPQHKRFWRRLILVLVIHGNGQRHGRATRIIRIHHELNACGVDICLGEGAGHLPVNEQLSTLNGNDVIYDVLWRIIWVGCAHFVA